MTIKRKSLEEIVEKILLDKFYKDFWDAELCPGDLLRYYNEVTAKREFYDKWLVENKFAEKV